jgi:Zn-dependent protease with chaperone function
MLGGRLVSPSTTDPDEKKLRNVVEEMALASGVPIPQIYVLDQEEGINAFAAGFATADAVVTVTRGSIRLLNRDELQGVIAHEFSHILNGDMRLNLRLMGLINGILCLAIVGRILLNTGSSRSSSDDDRKGGNPLPFVGLGLIVIGAIGVLFGRLIKSAVSRQREFLADASAVQFTRNPLGLAGALKKIGGLGAGSKLHSPEAESASHLFFANGLSESIFGLMSTHPPLEQRIRLLDPSFDGKFEPVSTAQRYDALASELGGEPKRSQPAPIPPILRLAQLAALTGQGMHPGQAAAGAGRFTPKHLAYAADVRAALPGALLAAAREPLGAVSLVYGLLLSADSTTRVAQIEQVKATSEPGALAEMEKIEGELSVMPREGRLPLLSLCLPTLRSLSPQQYLKFKSNIEKIIETDGVVDLFEFASQKLLLRNLEPHFSRQASPIIQYYAWQPLFGDAAVVLSALAYAGAESAEEAAKAFDIGWAQIRAPQPCTILRPDEAGIAALEIALDRFANASPFIKKTMLNACAYAVAADDKVCPEEAELLRAIGDVLGCPLPAFIEGV